MWWGLNSQLHLWDIRLLLLTAGLLQFSAHTWSSKTAKNSREIQVQMLGLSSLLSPFLWDFLLGFLTALTILNSDPTLQSTMRAAFCLKVCVPCELAWGGGDGVGGAGEVCVSSSFCLGLVVFCCLKAVVVLYFLQSLKLSLKGEVVYISYSTSTKTSVYTKFLMLK